MKKALLLIIVLLIVGCNKKGDNTPFIKVYKSDYNISVTIKRFLKPLKEKNYHLKSVINFTKEAQKLDFYLRPTKTIEIDNPKISTKLIECNPTMTIDLPIRIGVFRKIDGGVYLAFTSPEYWSIKHNIKDSECLNLKKLITLDLDEAKEAIKSGSK
ncbi:MAG: DUF302 domain-containing protein [Epsilonproteobacteria bacterium]|nr:DUF302 domain-containing protein [Campylobacterota bacterium]